MNRSQRCTKDVWTLANELVKWRKEAFFEIYMNPVEGRNPVSDNAIHAEIFEKPLEERNYI